MFISRAGRFAADRGIQRTVLGLAAMVLVACGPATLGGPCQQTCDCKITTAPIKCPGEWACNAQGTCEYSCKTSCDPAGVYTCRSGEDCKGNICSARLGCP